MTAQAYCVHDGYDNCSLDWCGCGIVAEGLWRAGNSIILKGASWVEQVGRSHVAAENIGELWRM